MSETKVPYMEESMQTPLEISEIERRMMEIDNQIKVLEQLLRDLKNEYERQKVRLEITRKRIAQSGIKY